MTTLLLPILHAPTLLLHAAPVYYKFPLPIWLYAVAGGAAVLASAPAAAIGVRAEAPERRTRNVYPLIRRLRLRLPLLALFSFLLAWSLVAGFGARTEEAHEFFENPMTTLTWVDLWVGLGVLATFLGNVWDLISPLNALARALDRALAARGVEVRQYPAALGRWPAVALLLVWTWMELVWPEAKNPPVLAAIIALYILATLVGTAMYGSEPWLANAELFTVVSRTFARFAPVELAPALPEDWLALEPEEREVRLRPFGAGVRTEPLLPAGGGAFVVTLLATVVYDGWSQTSTFTRLVDWIDGRIGWFFDHAETLDTILLLVTVAVFVLAYVLVCALMSGRGGTAATARRYAPTLIPIAAVYFLAHYLTYLLIGGQATLGAVVDPFGHSWNPWGLGEYPFHKGFLVPALVWWTEVGLIVSGHVIAVVEAHRVGLLERARPRRAALVQAPLVALMVGYTIAGLWVLAQQIKA